MWNVAGEPCVCLYSGAVTVGVCHTTMFSVVYIMTQAERLRQKRVAEKKKQQQKKQFNYWTMFFCLIFQKSKIVDTDLREWNCGQFLETWNICSDLPVLSQEKKNLYMYIFCNSVIGRLIICENVCVCWWIIHVGWIFLYIRFTFKYF